MLFTRKKCWFFHGYVSLLFTRSAFDEGHGGFSSLQAKILLKSWPLASSMLVYLAILASAAVVVDQTQNHLDFTNVPGIWTYWATVILRAETLIFILMSCIFILILGTFFCLMMNPLLTETALVMWESELEPGCSHCKNRGRKGLWNLLLSRKTLLALGAGSFQGAT